MMILSVVALLEIELRQVVLMAFEGANPALVGEDDRDRLFLEHGLFEIDVDRGRQRELGAALADLGLLRPGFAGCLDLLGDLLPLHVVRGEQLVEIALLLGELVVLGPKFYFFDAGQRPQPEVQDGVGLHLRQLERLHEFLLRLVLVADDADHLVQVEEGDQIAVEHLEPVADFLQPEFGAPDQHLLAVFEPVLEDIAQRQHGRNLARRQHVHVEAETGFELGQLEQALHQDQRIDGARLGLKHDTNVLGRFVAHVAEQGELLFLEQLSDLFHEADLLHLIGDLGDDDLVAAARRLLFFPFGAQPEPAAAGFVSFEHVLFRLDQHAAGREIGARNELDELFDGGVRMLDQMQQGLADLVQVVRRNVGRHADRDTRRTVGQQVREGRRKHDRLLLTPVVVRAEVDGVLVDALEQGRGDIGDARLGVAGGSRVIAVDVAEVALAVDQRVANREILGKAGQCVIDRGVAVGVVVAHGVADDLGALEKAALGRQAQLAHGVDDAPVNRLQPVAHVGQRPVHDGRQRIGQIALFQRHLQLHGLDRTRTGETRFVVHGSGLSEPPMLLNHPGPRHGGKPGEAGDQNMVSRQLHWPQTQFSLMIFHATFQTYTQRLQV